MWSAAHGEFTFVITLEDGVFIASAKPIDAVPFDGQLIEMPCESYRTLDDAKAACEEFSAQRTH